MSSDFRADHATQHADVCSVPPRRGHQDDQSPPEETNGDETALWIDLPGFLEWMGDTFEDLGGVGKSNFLSTEVFSCFASSQVSLMRQW